MEVIKFLIIQLKIKIKNKTNILVLPEGIESECLYMMKFILNKDFYNNNINFILRLHPLLSFDYLKKNILSLILKKNIIFFKEKFKSRYSEF